MPTSGIDENALRLLDAVYDLSGGKLNEAVPVEGAEGATARAGLDPEFVDRDLALRYLLDKNYVRVAEQNAAGEATAYAITVPGLDRARQLRGLDPPPQQGFRISDATQKRLLKALAIILALVLSRPLSNFFIDVPERRGIRDDIKEAVLQGLVRAVAVLLASLIVRRLTEDME